VCAATQRVLWAIHAPSIPKGSTDETPRITRPAAPHLRRLTRLAARPVPARAASQARSRRAGRRPDAPVARPPMWSWRAAERRARRRGGTRRRVAAGGRSPDRRHRASPGRRHPAAVLSGPVPRALSLPPLSGRERRGSRDRAVGCGCFGVPVDVAARTAELPWHATRLLRRRATEPSRSTCRTMCPSQAPDRRRVRAGHRFPTGIGPPGDGSLSGRASVERQNPLRWVGPPSSRCSVCR
jgi:hypothetical protein